MKAFIASVAILAAICLFVGIHAFVMIDLASDIDKVCVETAQLAQNDSWDEVLKNLDRIDEIWKGRRFWAALTISTKNIEEIEISLAQSRSFATLRQKPDFFGEFIMFQKLLEHIPHQEGFHIEEIL